MTATTTIDPLTIAYLAVGAARELDKRGGLTDAQADAFEGELGFIGAVIEHADMIEAEYATRAHRYGGVFAYEVAEEFGERCAFYYLSSLSSDRATFDNIARNLAAGLIERECAPTN